MASLDNPMAKLARAGEHLAALHEAAEAFVDEKPYAFRTERDADGWDVFFVEIRKEPPLRLSAILGDYLQNLRSALDNLVTQLILLNGKPLPRTTGFPVFDKERSYESVGVKRIKGVRPEHAALIESLQPYHGPHDPRRTAIEIVNTLANVDRHKALHPTFVGPARGDMPFTVRREPINTHVEIEGRVTAASTPLKDGAEVGRMRGRTPPGQPKVQVKADLHIEIAFGDRGLRLYALPAIGLVIGDFVKSFEPDFGAG